MKAGLGSYSITLPNGLTVGAIVAVNAVGDIIDPDTGKVVAGVRNPDGTLPTLARCSARDRPVPAPVPPRTPPSVWSPPTRASRRRRSIAWR